MSSLFSLGAPPTLLAPCTTTDASPLSKPQLRRQRNATQAPCPSILLRDGAVPPRNDPEGLSSLSRSASFRLMKERDDVLLDPANSHVVVGDDSDDGECSAVPGRRWGRLLSLLAAPVLPPLFLFVLLYLLVPPPADVEVGAAVRTLHRWTGQRPDLSLAAMEGAFLGLLLLAMIHCQQRPRATTPRDGGSGSRDGRRWWRRVLPAAHKEREEWRREPPHPGAAPLASPAAPSAELILFVLSCVGWCGFSCWKLALVYSFVQYDFEEEPHYMFHFWLLPWGILSAVLAAALLLCGYCQQAALSHASTAAATAGGAPTVAVPPSLRLIPWIGVHLPCRRRPLDEESGGSVSFQLPAVQRPLPSSFSRTNGVPPFYGRQGDRNGSAIWWQLHWIQRIYIGFLISFLAVLGGLLFYTIWWRYLFCVANAHVVQKLTSTDAVPRLIRRSTQHQLQAFLLWLPPLVAPQWSMASKTALLFSMLDTRVNQVCYLYLHVALPVGFICIFYHLLRERCTYVAICPLQRRSVNFRHSVGAGSLLLWLGKLTIRTKGKP